MTAKEKVQTILANLPDSCTLEDIQYQLFVAEKIERGIERAEQEGTIPHEEAVQRLSKWLSK